MSPLTGRRCHFVSFWQGVRGGASRVQGCQATLPGTRCPEPPTVGHVTCVPLCKVTLEAAPSRLLHSGAEAHSQNGAVQKSLKETRDWVILGD